MQSLCDLPEPQKLYWNVTTDVRNEIAQVAESFDRYRHYVPYVHAFYFSIKPWWLINLALNLTTNDCRLIGIG